MSAVSTPAVASPLQDMPAYPELHTSYSFSSNGCLVSGGIIYNKLKKKKKKTVYIQKEAVDHQQEGKGSTPASNPPETCWLSPACSEGVQPGAGVCRAHGHLLALLTTGLGANSRAGSP